MCFAYRTSDVKDSDRDRYSKPQSYSLKVQPQPHGQTQLQFGKALRSWRLLEVSGGVLGFQHLLNVGNVLRF